VNSLTEDSNAAVFTVARDVPAEPRSTITFERQKRVLAMLARGVPVDDVLAELCRSAEAIEPKSVAAILVLDRENRCFDRAIAPTTGPDYCASLAGTPVGPPHMGTCCAAVFRGEPITSTDVANDPRWSPLWRELHLAHNIRACRSTPILATDGRALGTFVVSFSTPSDLGAWDSATIELLVQLAALALERMRAIEDLKELNRTLEERVEDRTRERDRIWTVSQDPLLVMDSTGLWLSVNPAWTAVLGWSEFDLVGKTSAWIEHPDDRERTREQLGRLAAGVKTLRFENRCRHRDGSYRWFSWTAASERERFYCVARDVTEEKAAAEALQSAEEQLRQAQKIDAVGQLTSGLAHDFNNILSAILGNLEPADMRVGDESLRKMLQAATRAARRGSKLTEQLLVFARKHPLAPTAVDLVVDDQEDVREVMIAYLEALGHPTIQAASGRRAVELLTGSAAPAIDLLLVDYAMPGISGIEVARSARARHPDLPIIIVTGFVDTSFFGDWIDGAQLLRKPYRLHELAAAIEAAQARRGDVGTNVTSMTQRRS
jgi:PAS domain S-box-containing protein